MRGVSIVGTAQLPVKKQYQKTLREMGAVVTQAALQDAGIERPDALYLGNMLSDELQGQKHVAALVADEAGLAGIEALQVRAATATGAAALRMAYLAVASGAVETAVAVGAEKMSEQLPTHALAKALARREVADGATLISRNALLMQLYFDKYDVPRDAFAGFAVNAHKNAQHNPNALFKNKQVTLADVMASRLISPPIRLFDCSPICDGAAAVVLTASDKAHQFTDQPVHLVGSAVATDRFRIESRENPLHLRAAALATQRALAQAGVGLQEIDFFEVHDAFTIMACLLLEAAGFAQPGQGWRLAAEDEIGLNGRLPLSTMGGLKARGHPIGATALYQTCEIVCQLNGRAGKNQLPNPQTALLHSVGGAASTVLAHLFKRG